jgi:hypothetical protein
MIFLPFARRTWLVPLVGGALLLVVLPARGQTPPDQKSEIKAVVRISKQLLEDVVASEEIVAVVPFRAKVLGFDCQGVIDGRAKLAVEITTAQGNASFVVSSQGTAQTCV